LADAGGLRALRGREDERRAESAPFAAHSCCNLTSPAHPLTSPASPCAFPPEYSPRLAFQLWAMIEWEMELACTPSFVLRAVAVVSLASHATPLKTCPPMMNMIGFKDRTDACTCVPRACCCILRPDLRRRGAQWRWRRLRSFFHAAPREEGYASFFPFAFVLW